ncbi:hypothetical protein OS493_016138 [Desmophyllum pertusum]|uniref:Uncharacterized protein n=1 Tax=Desmophyllum pertusum TaxID=174260 RepID=A0A9X0A1P7_9CNID|nr:hypothetical protein OS493_016138 [Desmophyllum pertusum]
MAATAYELRKTNKVKLADTRQHKIIRRSPTRHREFIPFLGLVLVVLAILVYYLGRTQHFTIRGHFVNLKADTVIQYFGQEAGRKSMEVEKSTNNTLSKSSRQPEKTKYQDNMKHLDTASNATAKSSDTSQAEIVSNVALKLSPPDKKTALFKLESEQVQNETHTKASSSPRRKKGDAIAKMENSRQKDHPSLRVKDKKSTDSNAHLTPKAKQKMYRNLKPTSSIPNTLPQREKFNFDAWYRKKTVEVCGTGWQEKYRKLHADIINKRLEEKYLVYLCPGTRQGCCGYGNRLRAVVSLFYLSVLTDRAFLIDWRAPEPIENHLTPRNIQWNYTEPIDVCTGLQIRKHYWGSTKIDIREAEGWIIQDSSQFKKWLTTTDLKRYFDWPVEEITTIWYFAEGGITLNPYLLKRAKELGIAPLISRTPKYNLIGCAFDFLFTKSEAVHSKLNEMRTQLQFDQGPIIGIHIRTGDEQFDHFSSNDDRTWNSKNISRLIKFFDCATKVERKLFGNKMSERSNIRWFVSTDNIQVRDLVQEIYPRKVIASNLTIQHLDILFNTTIFNFTAECNYTDDSNTTLVCYNVELFNLTEYCANRTNSTLEGENNSTINGTGPFTDGIVAMLVDHFLLAESDFLILCDSSFGSTAVGLSMRNTDSYILADRGCVDLVSAQKNTRLRYFGRR